MSAAAFPLSAQRPRAFMGVLLGGLVAGGLDLCSAFISFGARVPRVIAAGLLGVKALQGGAGTYVLGIFLQFFIATCAAAVYYAASRKLAFLKEHALVCGLFYGIAVFLVMNLIVLPLSALHFKGPYQFAGLVQGILVHMILIGLPISFSIRQFSK